MTNSSQADGRKHRSVRSVIARVVQPLGRRAEQELPRDELCLWGEVLETRAGRVKHFVTLLDAEQDDVTLRVTLPASERQPEVGEMIAVVGALAAKTEGDSVRLGLEARCIHESKGPSRRQAELNRLVAELRARPVTLRPIDGPFRHVVLVSSPESKAVSDFHAALNRERHPPIDVSLVEVNLHDADSIAQGVLEAANTPTADVIVITRGGGGREDFVPFSSRQVVTAVGQVMTRLPIVTALGHHDDHETAADRVASRVESTPTSAAKFIVDRTTNSASLAHRADAAKVPHQVRTPRGPRSTLSARLASVMRRAWSIATRGLLLSAVFGLGWFAHAAWSEWMAASRPGAAPSSSSQAGPRTLVVPAPKRPAKSLPDNVRGPE